MPAAFYIALQRPLRGLKHDRRFPAFTALSHKLETLAEKRNIQSHMHFFDSPEESDSILGELEVATHGPSSYTWYPAAEGLVTLQTLRGHLEKLKGRANAAPVIEEIKEMEGILEAASKQKVGWCLTVDLDWKG